MKASEFCYWLQGYFEITDAGDRDVSGLTNDQLTCVRRHLSLVFLHDIDPKAGDAAHQQKLNEAHSPTALPPPKPPLAGPFHPQTGDGVTYRC